MPDCLILGATGFIGGQIARAAIARGWRVRAARRRPDATGDIGDLPVGWVHADLNDRASLVTALEGLQAAAATADAPSSTVHGPSSVLFHCAGAYPHNPRTFARDRAAGIQQMRNVLDAAAEAGVGRVIYTSSYTTIGQPVAPGRLADERDFYEPGSTGDPYYETKWAMEAEALKAAEAGLPLVVVNPAAVFGPGDVHMAVSGPLVMAARGRLPFYFEATLSVIDVRDAAEAHLVAAERGRAGERYILSGYHGTLRDVLAEMARVAGVRPPAIKIGPRLLRTAATLAQYAPGGEASFLKTMPLWRHVSNAKAVRELGLTTRPLSETMADTITWFRERGYL